MKKILFVVKNLKIGGLMQVNSIIADALSPNYDVSIYVANAKDQELKPNVNVISNNIVETPSVLYKYYRKVIQYIPILETKAYYKIKKRRRALLDFLSENNYDTIILNEENYSLCEDIKNSFPKSKVIIWTHQPYHSYEKIYVKHYKKSFERNFKIADSIVVLTNDDFKIYNKKFNNVVKINNPVTIDSQIQSNLKNKCIAFVGRIEIDVKGLDYLCEVARGIPEDWKIVVAGDGTDKEVARFRKMISDNNLKKKIILKGSLTKENLKKHYFESSLFITTSRWEGFGLVILEAMNFGLPIVSFSHSGSREILSNEGDKKSGILVPVGDIDEMIKNINLLIKDINLREYYSQKSIERVVDFSIENILKKWEEIL